MKYSILSLFQIVLHTERSWKRNLKFQVKLPSWYQLRKVTSTLTVSANAITDVTGRCISKGGAGPTSQVCETYMGLTYIYPYASLYMTYIYTRPY